ncbi:MAG: glycosyltransferase family 4 protein, partial [Roseiflexaceae bacterium]|nr:glycosyltransferase family 4 protein [Roseiflexaceae bacterium]
PVHHFPPRRSAGAELYTFRLARWLIQHGHTAEVVCVERIDAPGDGLAAVRDEYQGVPVWRLSFDAARAPDPLLWSYRNPLITRWFEGYLQNEQPDLVHQQSGYLMGAGVLEAAQRAGVPAVLTLHDFWFLCPRITLLRGDGKCCEQVPADPAGCAWCMRLESRRYRLADAATGGLLGRAALSTLGAEGQAIGERRRYLGAALRGVASAIAPSRFLAQRFAGLLEPEQIKVLRYGLDTTRLQHTPARIDDGVLRLGYIGQIAQHKGVHLLVQAVQALPPNGPAIEVVIYGDLDQHARYSRDLQQRAAGDARIRFAGRFDNAQIAEVLASFDATVVPSIWYENSPLAIMEAQAAGRPVITSALGGMAELVRDDVDGLHFQPNDAADLARQIQRLRDERGLIGRLRQGVTSPPTIDDEMAQLLAIYERACAGQGRATLEMAAAISSVGVTQ